MTAPAQRSDCTARDLFYLESQDGSRVEMPVGVAMALFKTVAGADATLDAVPNAPGGGSDDADAAQDSEDDEPLKLDNLPYSRAVLEAAVGYATQPASERTTSIPKPLTGALEHRVRPGEMALMRQAEEGDYLPELLDLATRLRFEELVALCAAYMSVRIDDIARAARDIMAGAESIRTFLHMENEWTPEEMHHLRLEMEYAKQVDPNVY